LSSSGKLPDRIAHFGNVTASSVVERGVEAVEAHLASGFYSLLHLAQAWGTHGAGRPLHLGIISNGLQRVNGEAVDPAKAPLLGPARVIPREYPGVTCAAIDIVSLKDEAGERKLLDQLKAELSTSENAVTAWRGADRFLESFEKLRLPGPSAGAGRVRQNGVYLITGGLGGLGLELAFHLARTARAKVVLASRREPTPQIAEKLKEIQALGGEVLVEQGDIGSMNDARRIVSAAERRFGALHGVFHAAGVLRDGPIQLKQRADADAVLKPKIRGTLVLHQALEGKPLDFLALFSSVSSVFGPAGQIDYTSANAFLDAFARSATTRCEPCRTVAINWGAWKETGMAFETAARKQNRPAPQGTAQKVSHPIWQECIVSANGEAVYCAEFSLGKYWVLDEHRFRG
ncbi:MAG TPA: SDR family NAD(P)-dependent oxidoreductase, partial [Sphingomonadales bacterium]|nr:SDR family NAD(P)-dependent oxidoreductase [Sphingomonadales bacterium]